MSEHKLIFLSLLVGLISFSVACEDFDETFDSDDDRKDTRAGELCSKPAGATGNCVPYEAEKRTAQSGTSIESNHSGFTGSGYVDFGKSGTWIEWNNIMAPVAGEYTFTFRYANGGSGNRQAAVSVKGGASKNVAFSSTGKWKSWRTVSTKLSLRKGSNTVVVKANTSAGGPNLDNMLVVGKSQVVEGNNIARGKPARQSSIAYLGYPARAVDGNTSGRWGDDSISHTDNTRVPWWRVDLGAAHRVDKVTLYNRTDCCGDRLSNFDVSLLGRSDNIIAKKYYAGRVQTRADIGISGSGVYAVRVQLRGTNYLSLAEVQVFGSKETGGNSRCAQADENKTARLSCPSGQKIKSITFASYGQPTGTCNSGFRIGTCHASSSKSKVTSACLNRQSCSISASNGTFGDPCRGTRKRLAVAYTCGTGVVQDQCPDDPNKTEPGVCGCGTPDTDSDRDGTPNCNDGCPHDRQKTRPGICGCGVPEGTCNNSGPLDKAGNTRLRIASWNNHRGSIFPKTSSLWRAINTSGKYHVTRTEGAARLIEAVDADIWLMQETCYSSSGLPSGVDEDDVERQIASYMKSVTGDSWKSRCNGRGLCTIVRGSIRFDGRWEKGTRVTGDRVILPDNQKVLLMNAHYMNSGNASDTKKIIDDIGPSVSTVFVGGDFNDTPGGSRYNIIDGISGMNYLSMFHWKDPKAKHLTSSLQNGKHKNTKGYMKWGGGPSGQDLVTSIGGGHIDHFFLKSRSWKAGNRFILNTLLFAPATLKMYDLEPLDIALQPQYYLKYFKDFLNKGIIYEIPGSAYDAGAGLDHDHLPMIVDFTW